GSTIPLNGFEGKYIQTSPMLTNDEVHRIKKMVNQKKLTMHSNKATFQKEGTKKRDMMTELEALTNYSQAILDLLRSLHVQKMKDRQTLESILQVAMATFEREERIIHPNKIIKKLQEREKLSGLGIPGTSAALYHTRSQDIIQPIFSIYTLTYPLTIQGMDNESMTINTILLMLAPEKAQQEVLEVFSFLSSLLIQDEVSLRLFSSGDREKVKNYLSEQYRTFLLEKNLL